MTSETNRALGVCFTRTLLGIILLMQGIGKVFKFGTNMVLEFFSEYEAYFSDTVLKMVMYFTSYGELIFGAFLVLGLFRFISYCGVAIILIIVSFGHGLHEVIWDMQHVMYRAILLIPLFLLPVSWDKFALDQLLFPKRQ